MSSTPFYMPGPSDPSDPSDRSIVHVAVREALRARPEVTAEEIVGRLQDGPIGAVIARSPDPVEGVQRIIDDLKSEA